MHCSSKLRGSLHDYLDDESPADSRELSTLIGQLWNCTDTLPRDYCSQLDIPQGSTYAVAVRRIKEMKNWPDLAAK